MEAIGVIEGTALPVDRSDVDTDQMIPAEYLKRSERTGFGPFLFADAEGPGLRDQRPALRGRLDPARRPDFGSGSSREHAPWAIEDAGFRAVLAPSFADIFRNNCHKIGLLPVELPSKSVRALMDAVLDDPTTRIEVDLEGRAVRAPGLDESFEIDDFTRWRLLEGLDDIGLTMRNEDKITAYEAGRYPWLPTASLT